MTLTHPAGFKMWVRWFRKQTFVCVPCRTVRRWPARSHERVAPVACVKCGHSLHWADRAPRRDDDAGWTALGAQIARRP